MIRLDFHNLSPAQMEKCRWLAVRISRLFVDIAMEPSMSPADAAELLTLTPYALAMACKAAQEGAASVMGLEQKPN